MEPTISKFIQGLKLGEYSVRGVLTLIKIYQGCNYEKFNELTEFTLHLKLGENIAKGVFTLKILITTSKFEKILTFKK